MSHYCNLPSERKGMLNQPPAILDNALKNYLVDIPPEHRDEHTQKWNEYVRAMPNVGAENITTMVNNCFRERPDWRSKKDLIQEMEQWFDFEAVSMPAEEVRGARKGKGGVIGGGIYMAGIFGGRYLGGGFGAEMALGRDRGHGWEGIGEGSSGGSRNTQSRGGRVRRMVPGAGRTSAGRVGLVGAQRIHMTLTDPTTKEDTSSQSTVKKGNVDFSTASVAEEGRGAEDGGQKEAPVCVESTTIEANDSSGGMGGIEITSKEETTNTAHDGDVVMEGTGIA